MDIVSISETWLKDHIDNNIINIQGYNPVRRDRLVRQHGGVCMYMKNNI